MVLISIHPFAFRKIFLLAALLLGLSSALCLADSLFMTRYYVPSEHRAGIPKSAGPAEEQTRSKSVSPLFEKLDGENSHADFEPNLTRPVPANGFSETDNYPTTPFIGAGLHAHGCVRRAEAFAERAAALRNAGDRFLLVSIG